RSRLREVFREFELRDPLRRLEEALGSADAAAPAPVAEQTVGARVREGSLADLARLPADEVAIAMAAPEAPEGALFGGEAKCRLAARADRRPRPRAGDERNRAAPGARAAGDGDRRRAAQQGALGRDQAPGARRDRRPGARGVGAGGGGVPDRLAPAARGGAVRQ